MSEGAPDDSQDVLTQMSVSVAGREAWEAGQDHTLFSPSRPLSFRVAIKNMSCPEKRTSVALNGLYGDFRSGLGARLYSLRKFVSALTVAPRSVKRGACAHFTRSVGLFGCLEQCFTRIHITHDKSVYTKIILNILNISI